jgi:membrane protein involved in colicin uptake
LKKQRENEQKAELLKKEKENIVKKKDAKKGDTAKRSAFFDLHVDDLFGDLPKDREVSE